MHRWGPITALGLSMLLCAVVSITYWIQPDSWTALLVLPRWLWLAPGLLLGLLGWTRQRKMLAVATAVLWLLYTAFFVEELSSLTRWRRWPSEEWRSARAKGTALRVVSLNCGGGSPKAAAETVHYQPDIVLLQESPLRRDVEELATQLFGADAGVLYGMDASIIAHGQLTSGSVALTRYPNVAQAHVRVASGLEVAILSVRLPPPLYEVRTDLWSPACWRAQSAARRAVRELMEALARRVETLPRSIPVIVGGDFNAPGRDGPFRAFGPRLHDAFRDGGNGWCNTIINELPFARIDQIWVSEHFRCESVVARRTKHSDHRMVVCDLVSVRNP